MGIMQTVNGTFRHPQANVLKFDFQVLDWNQRVNADMTGYRFMMEEIAVPNSLAVKCAVVPFLITSYQVKITCI